MGWFSKTQPEPRKEPQWTLRGNQLTGHGSRRMTLWAECARAVAEHPATSPAAAGIPIGDGHGLEELVALIMPIFRLDESLLPWVAIRGALASLYAETWDRQTRCVPFSPTVETVMGVGNVGDAMQPQLGVNPAWVDRLSPEQRQAAVGIFGAVATRLERYEEFSSLSTDRVKQLPRVFPSPLVALDIIAWSAAAMWRIEAAQRLVQGIPEPERMDEPGWYTEPLFAKAERYWDGRDWTSRVRTSAGEPEIVLEL